MTIVDVIIERAAAYPEREAIISSDGTVVRYGELAQHLPNVTEYRHITSGTTGISKEVIITDANLQLRLARLESIRPALASVQRLLVPLRSDFTLYVLLRSYLLLNGKTLFDIGDSKFDASAIAAMCAAYAVDGSAFIPGVYGAPSSAFDDLMDALGAHRFEHVFVSGQPATEEKYQDIASRFGNQVHINYGTSETGQITGCEMSDAVGLPGCVGRVADDVEVEIIDGNIRVRCATIVDGYVDEVELTAAQFHDGWFYPGDTGHFDGGLLVVTGRI